MEPVSNVKTGDFVPVWKGDRYLDRQSRHLSEPGNKAGNSTVRTDSAIEPICPWPFDPIAWRISQQAKVGSGKHRLQWMRAIAKRVWRMLGGRV